MLPTVKSTEPIYDHTAEDIKRAITANDRSRMRTISEHFYGLSGIYRRLLLLFSCMPNFDYLVIPHTLTNKPPETKLMKDFTEALEFVDGLNIDTIFPLITLDVFRYGVYFGYLRDEFPKPVIQSLPIDYCQSNYKKDNRYTVEFNVEYFDRVFTMTEEREAVLKQFPKEIQKAYKSFKSASGKKEILLDTDKALCFKFPDEMPFFLPIIIDLIELREAKNIELSKDRLELFQLLIQRMPVGKEGNLIFDIPEAQEMHKNAVTMLKNNDNIDVLTTFADMQMLNIKEARQVVRDNLLKTERSVFNEAGVSKMLFATEGNISLAISLLSDESLLRIILPQYAVWLSHAVNLFVNPSQKYYFEVWMPPTTIFNTKELEERYRKQATLGYGKLVPGVIAGIKQSSLLNLIKFENDYLKLNDMMEPLQSSHTMSPTKETGRPKKPGEEKSEESLENEETGNQGGEED